MSPKPGKPKDQAPEITPCAGETCKAKATKFSFCEEHYEQFKFGLIKKDGKAVSDYEKKFGHYEAYKAKTARKAA